MGGTNEVMAAPPIGSVQKNEIRIHENNNEIHFHDDPANVRVAVDKANMLSAYRKAEAEGWTAPVELISKDQSSIVTLRRHITKNSDLTIKDADLEIIVRKITLGGNFAKLRKALGI